MVLLFIWDLDFNTWSFFSVCTWAYLWPTKHGGIGAHMRGESMSVLLSEVRDEWALHIAVSDVFCDCFQVLTWNVDMICFFLNAERRSDAVIRLLRNHNIIVVYAEDRLWIWACTFSAAWCPRFRTSASWHDEVLYHWILPKSCFRLRIILIERKRRCSHGRYTNCLTAALVDEWNFLRRLTLH